jgi:hypothetical protein
VASEGLHFLLALQVPYSDRFARRN